MWFRKWMVFGLICFAVVLVNMNRPATASEQEKGEAVYTLGEVVVTAKRGVAESVGTVRQVTAVEIKASGAKNLAEAVKLLPGIQVQRSPRGESFINLRGFRPRHVLLLLDGIPFNSTYDGQFDASMVPVDDIAKIKVIYGTHSVLYGQGGLGGVINIITKKGTQGLRGHVSGETADRSTVLGQGDISGAGGDPFSNHHLEPHDREPPEGDAGANGLCDLHQPAFCAPVYAGTG